jgi:hypothetical protein
MTMRKLLLFFVAISISVISFGQSPACNGAVDLNSTNAFMGAAQTPDPVVDYGCIDTTGQYVWYGYFTVCSPGQVTIQTSTGNSGNDVDLVVWGPFMTTGILCSQLTSPMVTACDTMGGNGESVTFSAPMQGFTYMVAAVAQQNTATPFYFTTGSTAVFNTPCSTWTNCFPNAGYEQLCYVTVDSATQEYKMIWNELPGNPATHFGILKADYMGVFQEIDTVHITSLSEYIDVSADPNVHTEQYAIMTYDTCGTFWQATGTYIQPVFCQSSLSTQGTVNVAWSGYFDSNGNGPAYYVVYRGATPASMVSIDTVASFVNYYTDINPLVGTSYYKIGVALYSACVPMRLQQSAQSQYWVQSFSNAAPITVVGIGENSLQEVSLFPNPSDGNITVKNLNAVSVMSVYDLAGRVVVLQQLQANSSQQISLQNLEPGIYSLTIENETGFFREEVVIRH